MARIRFFFRNVFRRAAAERSLNEELQASIEILANEKIDRGVEPVEALRQARVELGGVEQIKEEVRRQRGTAGLDSVLADLRYSARILRKNPAFSAVAVLSLALGIGANTAVFSVIDALLLKRLPVENPDQLVIFRVPVGEGNAGISYPVFEQFRARSRSFSSIIAHGEPATRRLSAENGEALESVRADIVSAGYFSTLGLTAAPGRVFIEEGESSGVVTVISHGFWQRRFSSDPNVIGRTIRLNDRPVTIIGVAPRGFTGVEVGRSPDLWLPLESVAGSELKNARNTLWLTLLARLSPGVSMDQAQAEVDTIFGQMRTEPSRPGGGYFNMGEQRIQLEPGRRGWTELRRRFSQQLIILLGIVAFLLCIACANVSSLLMARGTLRRKEIAVRLAIGGGRPRVIRQLLTESATLSGLGALIGLGFADWGTQFLLKYLLPDTGSFLKAGVDPRALLFASGISIVSTGVFGLAPAFRTTKLDPGPTLKGDAWDLGRLRPRTLNRFDVVFQVALSMILLVGAGLFVRTLRNLRTLDAGFDRDSVIQFSISPGPGFSRPQLIALHQQMLDRLEGLPGVSSATFSANAMLADATRTGGFGEIEGYTRGPDERILTQWFFVAPKFFETVGLPLVMGRGIARADENSRVLVINQAMANRYFAGRDPIGQHLSRGDEGDYAIVGVAQDAKYHRLREETPLAVYAPFSANASPINAFSLRTAGDRSNMANTIRSAAKEINPRIIVSDLRTMGEVADATLIQERLMAQLAGFCSVMALFLACIGLFGVLSYNVTQKTREIGIRMALGARAEQVIQAVMRETLVTVGTGVLLGLAGALALTRFISSLLFGISATDPWTIITAILVLVITAAVAGYFPARRAGRVDPLVALRHE